MSAKLRAGKKSIDEVDKTFARLRRNPLIAAAIVFGIAIISLATFAESIGTLLSPFSKSPRYTFTAVLEVGMSVQKPKNRFNVSVDIVNLSKDPMYVACLALHALDDAGSRDFPIRGSTMQPGDTVALTLNEPRRYETSSSVDGLGNLYSSDTRAVWLSLRLSTGSTFVSQNLRPQFEALSAEWDTVLIKMREHIPDPNSRAPVRIFLPPSFVENLEPASRAERQQYSETC